MLSLFDRYIIRQYFVTFFFSAFLFTLIALAIDFSERVNNFIEHKLSARQVIVEYYLNFIPWINGVLWPLFALIAVVFFTARMAKNSEMIAALGAGMSFTRLLRPYLISAFVLATIHFLGSHIFIPNGNKTFIRFDNTYIHPGNARTKTDNIHIFLTPDSRIFIRNYRSRDTSMREVFLEKFDSVRLVTLIKAEKMQLLTPPNTWRLSNYEIRNFDNEFKETITVEQAGFLDTTLNLEPRDFVRYINQSEMMTTKEIREFIAYERSKGLGTAQQMQSEVQRRSADPFTILVLTVIGAAVAARKVRGGVGVHLASGIIIGASYILLSRFAMTFASQLEIHPALAIWVPNFIFTTVAIWLVLRAQK
ncbi:MAG TPA: LptF/LptG family permease [Anaerolineales bacterium]|nr:LptF/LptG family permease [Anaerolineales bacterium]